MRKLSFTHSEYLKRKAAAGSKSRTRSHSQIIIPKNRKIIKPIITLDRLIIDAPRNFSLETNRLDVLGFLTTLRLEASRGAPGRQLIIDLGTIRELELAASLALVAELDRWQREKRLKLTPDTLSTWCPNVVNKLVMLGFFRLLKTDVSPRLVGKPDDIWIPYTSGVLTIGLAAKRLRERLESNLGFSTGLSMQIYASLVEAMKNAYQHAYPEGQVNSHSLNTTGRRWWMAGKVDPAAKTIDLVFLDQGITIPVSLPNSWIWKELRADEQRAATSDGARIVQAMSYGRSRLAGQTHRGKGFSDIRFPLRLNSSNTLRIFSRAGAYEESANFGFASNNLEAFGGTLIAWHLQAFEPIAA